MREALCAGPLVRAAAPDGIAIWTEWKQPCEITLLAKSEQRQYTSSHEHSSCLVRSHTVTVGGRHYALSVLKSMQPGTWYTYYLSNAGTPDESEAFSAMPLQCFRTLDLPDAKKELRLAYGSCRNLSTPEPDALSAFGFWLCDHLAERDVLWPHLLLLLGDQIYADAPAGKQAQTFEAFARLYVSAWTGDKGVRQVLATIPSAMIFDDHEITNNWNIGPAWQAWALRQGWEHTLVDGLVAYWIYQGWGNVGLQDPQTHDLLTILQQAEHSGEDALEALRARVRQTISQEKPLQWDYTLPTMPPIFVADLRADRSRVLKEDQARELPPRILSREQMARLHVWAQEHATTPLILASSVPALLPPAIGYAEYVMGKRLFQGVSAAPVRRLSHLLFTRQQRFSWQMGFEHWPVFHETWRELVTFFETLTNDLLILSGDVHFSYAIAAHILHSRGKEKPMMYQLVASPFRNVLGAREKRLILSLAWLRRAIYGELSQRVLPLRRGDAAKPAPAGMLLQNVIALARYQPSPRGTGNDEITQVYLGVADQTCVEVGSTSLKERMR